MEQFLQITLFVKLLGGIGVFQKEVIDGKRLDVLTIGEIKHIIIRHLPVHLVEAILKIAADYPITLEFIEEFLRRSKENKIVKHSIVIPSEVTEFFDNLKLPQNQIASCKTKLDKAIFEYQSAVTFVSTIEAERKDVEIRLQAMKEFDLKKWKQFKTTIMVRDEAQKKLDALKAYGLSVEKMKEAFGEFTFQPIDSSLPSIDHLQEEVFRLSRVIERESLSEPDRRCEILEKEMSFRALNIRLKEANGILKMRLENLEKVQLNIQRIKLGLTEIA
jgi:hypothetical protein